MIRRMPGMYPNLELMISPGMCRPSLLKIGVGTARGLAKDEVVSTGLQSPRLALTGKLTPNRGEGDGDDHRGPVTS